MLSVFRETNAVGVEADIKRLPQQCSAPVIEEY